MKKLFLIILACIIGLTAVASSILWIFSRIHHQSVHQEVVGFLNHHLPHSIHFKDLNLSYLKKFPNIQIELQDILIKDGEKELLKIGELELVLKLKNLGMNSFELKKIIAMLHTTFAKIKISKSCSVFVRFPPMAPRLNNNGLLMG